MECLQNHKKEKQIKRVLTKR